jgi:hypothetical protein
MHRDERLCASTSAAPHTLWRPSSGWLRHNDPGRLPFRVECVDKAKMGAEMARCARYDADTEEHSTQCWTAGCMASRHQCRPFQPPAASRTPHLTEMAMCVKHATKQPCHAEPHYRCRFDHDMVCVPNNVEHVPLHMQRRLVRPTPKRSVRRPPPATYRKGDQVLLDDGPVVVAEVRRRRTSRGVIYRVHNHSGAQLWVPEDMLHPMPPSLADPYTV